MRIKNFTLMLLAFLVSAVCLAGKPTAERKVFAFDRNLAAQKLTKQGFVKAGLTKYMRELPAGTSSKAAKAPAKATEVVTPPEDGELEYFTLTGTGVSFNSSGQPVSASVKRTVKVVWDGDDVYVSGLSYYLPDAFAKGVFVDDETIVFEKGQFMGNIGGADIYFGGLDEDDDGNPAFADAKAEFDEEEGSFAFTDIIFDNGDPEELGYYAYMMGVKATTIEEDPNQVVEIPNDLEIETYAYSAYDYFEEGADVSGNVNVGIYGDDVYIQGMSTDIPEAWIKGTFTDETTVVFRSGQLLSNDTELYFVAINDNFDITDEYILIYDPETGSFTEGAYAGLINAYSDKIDRSVYQFYYGYEIKKISEKAATPAKSLVNGMKFMPDGDYLEFTLAKVDTDGDGLVAEKLKYILYSEDAEGTAAPVTLLKSDYPALDEDLTEIPASLYGGLLPLNMSERESWVRVGIQGVYYGGDERHESEIAWYTPTWPQTITLPEGLTVTEHDLNGKTNRGVAVERVVGLALDGDDMYIRGLGSTNKTAWVKGTKNSDGDYVFPKGQDLGDYDDEDRLFLLGYADDKITDVVLKVDTEGGVYEFITDFIENADYTDKTYYVQWVDAGATITIAEAVEEVPEPVAVPEDLVAETWTFSGTAYFSKNSVSRNVLVGFYGEDVYIQGLSEYLPEAWVKGTLEDGQITLPTAQYLGYSDEEKTALWSIGFVNGKGVSDYVMTYDAENFTMSNPSSSEFVGTTAVKNMSNALYDFYYGVTIKKLVEKAATPETPYISHLQFSYFGDIVEFSIPAKDVEGDGLVTDKLSYKLYYDLGDGEAHEVTFTTDLYEALTEDMTVIPYGFVDSNEEHPYGYDFDPEYVYLNMDHSTWARVGIQSVYTGGGEVSVSEIGWYTIIWPQVIELPDGAEVATYGLVGKYMNYDKNNKAYYTEFSKPVTVAKVDDDVFIQGVGRFNDQAWIKGTKGANGVYNFSRGQYMGVYPSQQSPSHLFLVGYNNTLGVMDVKMSYDEETGIFTTTTELLENADYVDKSYFATRIVTGARIIPADNPDAITTVDAEAMEGEARYNVAGQLVGKSYKGIVVKGGKKLFQK